MFSRQRFEVQFRTICAPSKLNFFLMIIAGAKIENIKEKGKPENGDGRTETGEGEWLHFPVSGFQSPFLLLFLFGFVDFADVGYRFSLVTVDNQGG